MTSDQAGKLVVASMVVSGVTITLAEVVKEGTPKPRIYIAGAVVYLFLAFLADFSPKVAGPLAILIMVAILLGRGQDAFGGVGKVLPPKGAAK